ncbi:MAG: hypothetical protein HY665_09400 [Chloroflexi bacterium]|nr:hypothetical protein [Chloroflexota bacterium]
MKEKTIVLPANAAALKEFNCICRSDPLRPGAADAMKTSKVIMEVVINTALIALPGDLLYLYIVGSWYDPIEVVEITELVILSLLPVIGLFRFYALFRTFVKHTRNKFGAGTQPVCFPEEAL